MKTTKWGKALNVIAPVVGATAGAVIGQSGDTAVGGAVMGSIALQAARTGITNAAAKKNRNLGKQFK